VSIPGGAYCGLLKKIDAVGHVHQKPCIQQLSNPVLRSQLAKERGI